MREGHGLSDGEYEQQYWSEKAWCGPSPLDVLAKNAREKDMENMKDLLKRAEQESAVIHFEDTDKMTTRAQPMEITPNSFLLVKIGSEGRPAKHQDITDMQSTFEEALNEKFPNLPVIITHHDVDVQVIHTN